MIHRLRIRNFKSIVDVEVEFSEVTVLVGKSGTGKSNFVGAIRFLRDLLAGQLQSHHWNTMVPATSPNSQMAFDVEFDVPGFDERFQYSLTLHENGVAHNPRDESLKYGDVQLFHQAIGDRNQPGWVAEPELVIVPKAGDIALRRLPGLEHVVVAYTALSAGIGVYDFESNVLCQGGRAAPQGRAGLLDRAENFLSVLGGISRSLHDVNTRKGILSTLQRLNSTVVALDLDSVDAPKTVIVGHRFNSKTLQLDLTHESDGFRRFLAYLLAIYQAPAKLTLVFDEPENGIYPGALSMLASEFLAAPAAGRGQVILTTHSPRLLDQFSAEQVRVVELVDLTTRIGPLAADQREAVEEELIQAGELLTVDPARLEGAGA